MPDYKMYKNVEFGIMEEECSIILQRFFKDLRKK